MKHKLDTVSSFKILVHAASVWYLLVNFLNPAALTAAPVSTDATSLARLAILTNLSTGSNSFATVFTAQANSINAITNFLTAAITPNAADTPNPPINGAATGPSLASLLNDQNCTNTGDCLAGFMPLAFALSKLPSPFPGITVAQYSNLMANLLYSGANVNLANAQLSKYQLPSLQPKLLWPLTTPVILANFATPDTTTYPGLAVDQYAGILIKTPVSTPAGTASQFCTDLVAANPLNLTNTAADPLTADNIWLGGICTNSTAVQALGSHCCGNNICNTTSGANLGQDSAGNAYGYCAAPNCLGIYAECPNVDFPDMECCDGLDCSNLGFCLVATDGASVCDPQALYPQCPAGYTCQLCPAGANSCITGSYICLAGNDPYAPAKTHIVTIPCCPPGSDKCQEVPCMEPYVCDPAPQSHTCCLPLNASGCYAHQDDCCTGYSCEVPAGAPAGTKGVCKMYAGQDCAEASQAEDNACISPLICGQSQGAIGICCGPADVGADCSDSNNDCCDGVICRLDPNTGKSKCVSALSPGDLCAGYENYCPLGYTCYTDLSSPACWATCTTPADSPCKADACPTMEEACLKGVCAGDCVTCSAASECCNNCDTNIPALTCDTKTNKCQQCGGLGSFCTNEDGDPNANTMCCVYTENGDKLDNVLCYTSNDPNSVGRFNGVCCLAIGFSGCTLDIDCCADNRGPVVCSSGTCKIQCVGSTTDGSSSSEGLCQGAIPVPISPPTIADLFESTDCCQIPGQTAQPSCVDVDNNGVTVCYIQLTPIGDTCDLDSDCQGYNPSGGSTSQCLPVPATPGEPAGCSGTNCWPATPGKPAYQYCCLVEGAYGCSQDSDCCASGVICYDAQCVNEADEVTGQVGKYLGFAYLFCETCGVLGRRLTRTDLFNAIDKMGAALELDPNDLDRIKETYRYGMFGKGAGQNAALALARKNYIKAVVQAIINKAGKDAASLTELQNAFGVDNPEDLVTSITIVMQSLIQGSAGDLESIGAVIGEFGPTLLGLKGPGSVFATMLTKLSFGAKILQRLEGFWHSHKKTAIFLEMATDAALLEKAVGTIETSTARYADMLAKLSKFFATVAEVMPEGAAAGDVNADTFYKAATTARAAASKYNPAKYGPPYTPPAGSPAIDDATVYIIQDDYVAPIKKNVGIAGKPLFPTIDAAFAADPVDFARLYFVVKAGLVQEGTSLDSVTDAMVLDQMKMLFGGQVLANDVNFTEGSNFTQMFTDNAEKLGTYVGNINFNAYASLLDSASFPATTRQQILLACGMQTTDKFGALSGEVLENTIKVALNIFSEISTFDTEQPILPVPNPDGSIPPVASWPNFFGSEDGAMVAFLGSTVQAVATVPKIPQVKPVETTIAVTTKSNVTKAAAQQPVKLAQFAVKKQVPVKPAPVKPIQK